MLDYTYKANPGMLLVGLIFFGACGSLLAHEAMTNTRGLVLNGLLHFGVQGATVFYWLLALAAMVFVALAVVTLVLGVTSDRRLTLSEASLSLPRRGFSNRVTVVPLRTVTGLAEQVIQRRRLLTVSHTNGTIAIHEAWLPDARAFESVRQTLVSALAHRTSP